MLLLFKQLRNDAPYSCESEIFLLSVSYYHAMIHKKCDERM